MEIDVKNLTKKYGETNVLENISFSIDRGEIVGFLGPNGAGKTTTMRILTGYIAPTNGDVTISNLNILDDALLVRKKIGYLPENNPLYNEMKVYEYLEFMAMAKGIQNVLEEVKRVITICSLVDRVSQEIGELSKGYRQRVGLSQALLGDPEIIILDEPTSGLDPNQIVEIRNLIKNIGKTKTIILSTHILSEVEASCSRAIIIHNGKIVASGTPQELVLSSRGKAQVSIIVSERKEEFENGLKNISGVEKVSHVGLPQEVSYTIEVGEHVDPRKDIFNLCVEKNIALLGMEYKTMSLEDVFRQLTRA